jgi:hypothetical protein
MICGKEEKHSFLTSRSYSIRNALRSAKYRSFERMQLFSGRHILSVFHLSKLESENIFCECSYFFDISGISFPQSLGERWIDFKVHSGAGEDSMAHMSFGNNLNS